MGLLAPKISFSLNNTIPTLQTATRSGCGKVLLPAEAVRRGCPAQQSGHYPAPVYCLPAEWSRDGVLLQ